ncbi:hypothetical protein EYF80_007003 [Liparis tanakae]|uniref:Uncharacterized protein n=1 Tax=Liparis tanakae TaxID=230148 RepID=A0A4Z2IZQ4_9TELE|nr:hypothetical protein EYF80_007003 [Liparis tanakae]
MSQWSTRKLELHPPSFKERTRGRTRWTAVGAAEADVKHSWHRAGWRSGASGEERKWKARTTCGEKPAEQPDLRVVLPPHITAAPHSSIYKAIPPIHTFGICPAQGKHLPEPQRDQKAILCVSSSTNVAVARKEARAAAAGAPVAAVNVHIN